MKQLLENIRVSAEQLEASLISKLWKVLQFITLFWKSKCSVQIWLIKCRSSHLQSCFFFNHGSLQAWMMEVWYVGWLFKSTSLNLADMLLPFNSSLLCAAVLSFCVVFYSVLLNINCICHCRGADTPGEPALSSFKTHLGTNNCFLISGCIPNSHIQHVPHTQTHTETPSLHF